MLRGACPFHRIYSKDVIKIGIDSWTKHPYELKMRERATRWAATKSESVADKLKGRFADFRDGTCKCGACSKSGASTFRGGVAYHSECLDGKHWAKSKLPEDRTPPSRWGGQRWEPKS